MDKYKGSGMSDTTYSLIRTTSKVDDTPYKEILALFDAKDSGHKFGAQGCESQDGLAAVISCNCSEDWDHLVEVEPRMAELIFDSIPSYAPIGCLNMSLATLDTLVHTYGASGVTFSPVLPEEYR